MIYIHKPSIFPADHLYIPRMFIWETKLRTKKKEKKLALLIHGTVSYLKQVQNDLMTSLFAST
jgi:hypothetical protein